MIRARRGGGLPLAFLPLLLTYLAVAMNLTVANVALPTISRVMPASGSQLVWLVNITPLASAALILFAGSWGDRFGRRRVLVLGIAVFLVAALLSANADSINQLIALRALTGVGSALVMPAAMALTFQVVSEPARRGAIGLLSASQAVGALLGPLLAGSLLVLWDWGAAFLAVTPLLLIALVLAARMLPQDTTGADHDRVDVVGATLMALGGVLLLYTAVSASTVRDPGQRLNLSTLAAALTCLGLLAWWETWLARQSGRPTPIFVRSIVTDRRFWLPTLIIAGVQLVLGLVMFGTTQFVQLVLGYSALVAGLFLTPTLLVWTLAAAAVDRLARRLGDRRLLGSALAIAGVGLVVIAMAAAGHIVPVLLLGAAMAGAMGAGPALLTHMAVSVYPDSRRTVGSAINSVAMRFGLSFGVALGGLVITTILANAVGPLVADLGASLARLASNSLGGALEVAADLPSAAGGALEVAARDGFTAGFSTALLVAAALLVLLAVAGARWLPSQGVVDSDQQGDA